MSTQPSGRGRGRARAQKKESTGPERSTRPAGPSGDSRPSRPGGMASDNSEKDLVSSMQSMSTGQPKFKSTAGGLPASRHGGSGDDNGSSSNGNGKGNGRSIGRGGVRGQYVDLKVLLKTRPDSLVSKCGSYGRPVELECNYFKLQRRPDWVIFQYRVDFNVDEQQESVKRKWLREHVDRIGRAYIFDGTVLFSSQRLTQDNKPLLLTSVRETDNFPVQIEIRLVQQLAFGNIVYLQVFNILVRRSLALLNLQLVGRNYFDASAAIKVSRFNMEIWPGYLTAIRQHEKDILMCAEISCKVLRTDTAFELLAECTKQGQDYRRIFQQAIIGEIVLTDYNNKTYRVHDVDFNVNPRSTFQMRNENISYVDYYQNRYNIRIKDLRQPLLVIKNSARSIRAGLGEKSYLIPELCRMTGLSNRMRENHQLMRGLADYTRVDPRQRIERLVKFNERLQKTPEIASEFKNWDLSLERNLLKIPGRELPPETIVFGRGQKYSAGTNTDWTRNLRSSPMLKNGVIKNWTVICPIDKKSDVFGFLDCLRRAAEGMFFTLPPPQIYETHGDRVGNILEAVEDILGRSKQDILMFVCSNDRADRYNAIKKKCYVDRGIPSQVVLHKKITSKGALTIATKVAIQINCKIGGAPWSVDIPMENAMVIGYDVCHDTSSRGKSYGAMVASLNKAMSAWFSAVSHHSSGEELSDSLSLDVCKALRKYREFNGGNLPSRIFVYRDGVGDGQIDYVYNHEVALLKKRLSEIYNGDSWRLCYIIVTKRINTRLFKQASNPLAGTVVDDIITLPERYDFFLVSQSVNSGTVSPTSYNVISDNVGLNQDQIQRWTYKMTHLYYNWSGTVRVPAPCQYAHKLAFLVSQSLHMQPHPNLDTSLYFL